MKPAANRELVGRFRQGDEDALDRIVRKHYALVQQTTRALCRSEQEANELLVLVFIHSWKCRKKIKVNESIPNYFIRVTQNVFKKRSPN